jgi:DNA-binding NarL/FixJ family response regulator
MSHSPPKARMIRVLLVDDHPTVRETLCRVLQAYPNIEVVGEASDGEEALAQVEHLQPAVVVMDINMPRMDGITATRLIKVQYPETAVIGLSLENREYQLFAMKNAGAFDVLPKKEMSVAEFFGAIQNAVATVQPIVIMEETPPQKQALDMSQPSDTIDQYPRR